MNQDDMASLLVSNHRPGFYFRVLTECEVGASDEIIKVANGPERMTVSSIDALLYLPGRTREQLARSLSIPALSPGWRASFEALLNREVTGEAGPTPAWPGFRALRVAKVDRESASMTPVLAMLQALASQSSTREIWWFHGARSGSDHPFARESQEALRTLTGGHSHIAYSKPGLEDQPGLDYDSHGRLDVRLFDQLGVPRPRGEVVLSHGCLPHLRDRSYRRRGSIST